VVIPQNLSAAVNYNCRACVTYALAQQLVITLPGDLSAGAMTQLDDVWRRIEAFSSTISSLPVEQIAVELTKFEREILAIVETDTGRDLDGSDATPAPSSSSEPVAPEASTPPSETPTSSAEPTTGASESTGTSPSAEPSTTSSTSPSPTGTATPSESPTP